MKKSKKNKTEDTWESFGKNIPDFKYKCTHALLKVNKVLKNFVSEPHDIFAEELESCESLPYYSAECYFCGEMFVTRIES